MFIAPRPMLPRAIPRHTLPAGFRHAKIAGRGRIVALTPRVPSKGKKKKEEKKLWAGCGPTPEKSYRPGIGFGPVGSVERTEAERKARRQYEDLRDGMTQEEAIALTGVLNGGPLDQLFYTLRAAWLDRIYDRLYKKREPRLTDDVEALYDLVVKEIRECDSLYYADDPRPKIPDREYDELVLHLIELERHFPELIKPDSPSQTVGHCAAARSAKLYSDNDLSDTPLDAVESSWRPVTHKWRQVQHPVSMLSLANAYSSRDLLTFAKRVEGTDSTICVEMKIDGVALSLHYQNRKLELAATRGNGRIGDDVTVNVRAALLQRGVPEVLPDDAPSGLVIVRGEVFISPQDFATVNALLDVKMSNARNAAAGALKHKDSTQVAKRRIQFIAYDCVTSSPHGHTESTPSQKADADPRDGRSFRSHWATQEETLRGLEEWQFGAMQRYRTCDSVKAAEEFASQMELARKHLPFEADGIVLKINDSELRARVGHTAKAPRGAIAYKFAARSVLTTISNVVMQVSRSGVITPVAELQPVVIGGATISRATLHNFDEIKRLDVAVGDTVRLERGGDVIPKIVAVHLREEEGMRTPIDIPKECPCCGAEVSVEQSPSTTVICTDSVSCAGQNLGRLIHFASRNAMDISGLGTKTASKLLDSGLVVLLADLFKLSVDDILDLDGYAAKSAATLHESIQNAATSRSVEQIIIALGIPGVGRASARALALKAITLDRLLHLGSGGRDGLLSLPNVAEKSAESIVKYINSPRLQREIKELALVVSPARIVDDENSPYDALVEESETASQAISGKTFAITGTLNSMARPAIVRLLKGAGGRVVSTVTKKTDYLISGVDPGFKYYKAQRIQVPILFEEDLPNLFGELWPAEQAADGQPDDRSLNLAAVKSRA